MAYRAVLGRRLAWNVLGIDDPVHGGKVRLVGQVPIKPAPGRASGG